MASRRSVGSQIIFHGPRAASARSGGSVASNSTAHAVLARRLLFPRYPPNRPLPPLISLSNGDSMQEGGERAHDAAALKALNDEIYDFLALAVRGFILPWWSKITPRDKEFPQEVTKIVTHLIKQLEARVLVADLPCLIANTIPTLITQHYVDYRAAEAKFPTSYATGLHGNSDSLHHLFHSLQPHMAVSPEGVVDPNYVRQVVEHIMKACLPPEDWDAETERTIIREIVVKIMLENAFPRLSQPWFLQKLALELLGTPAESTGPPTSTSSTGWTLNTLVILFLSAVQTVSGFAIAAIAGLQSGLHVIAEVNHSPHYAKGISPNADLVTPVIDLVSEVLNARESATMSAILSLLQLFFGFFASFLNRLIPYLFYSRMHPSMFTKAVSQGKKVLFPNGYPGPPPVEPTPEEQILIREQLEERLCSLVPPIATKLLFGPNLGTQRRTVRGIIDPLGSSKCNVHLLVFILDAILVCVFPELALRSSANTKDVMEMPTPSDQERDTPLHSNHSPFDTSNPLED